MSQRALMVRFSYNGKAFCYWCGCEMTLKTISREHIIPSVYLRRGLQAEVRTVAVHIKCNLRYAKLTSKICNLHDLFTLPITRERHIQLERRFIKQLKNEFLEWSY
jgi:hypothetical protein